MWKGVWELISLSVHWKDTHSPTGCKALVLADGMWEKGMSAMCEQMLCMQSLVWLGQSLPSVVRKK